MAFTLAEMKVGMTDKVAAKVVDVFLRESEILQLLPFDDTVSPQGGSTLTYSYMQKVLPSTASFRKLNEEYSHSAATMVKKSADLKIFGGEFDIDRVLKQAEGMFNNMAWQMEEKIRAAERAGIRVLLIDRPAQESGYFLEEMKIQIGELVG